MPAATAQRGGVRKFGTKNQKPPAGQAKTAALPAYQPAPLTPVPLDQVPAIAPVVKYKDGELTIEAHNSTLADVLKAVHQQTGAELELPPNATERVVADIGPGPAREVLAELLNGTHFNYVMVGSSSDPSAVHSIFLTSKASSSPGESAGAARPRPPEPAPVAVVPEPADSAETDDAESGDEQPATDQTAEQQNSGQPAPKTPEQLLQELQRQQQQAQQKKQPGQDQPGLLPNQPPTAAPPPPNKPE
jgi:hypothetical protein